MFFIVSFLIDVKRNLIMYDFQVEILFEEMSSKSRETLL